MLVPSNVIVEKPTSEKQKAHLVHMDLFFGENFLEKSHSELIVMNIMYGAMHTSNINEYCDTMHTALYWLEDNYSHVFKLSSAVDVMRTYTKMEAGEEKIENYKMDAVFGEWVTNVVYDTQEMRDRFMKSLKTTEDEFISALVSSRGDYEIIETYCFKWIKKIGDPAVIAAFGNYMIYMMTKAIIRLKGLDCGNLKIIMTSIYALVQSSSKLCVMASHNLNMN